MKKVLIVGAGIGGLTVALALQRVGIQAQIFERSKVLQAAGAGLGVEPNAMRVYQHLGLLDRLQQRGVLPAHATLRLCNGRLLAEVPLKALAEKHGIAMVGIHRADLQDVLLLAVSPSALRLGAQAKSFEQDEAGVSLHLADGQQARGDLLIGADGIHSVVRAQLFGEPPLHFAGYTTWRGVVAYRGQLALNESWGRGRRFGYTPLQGELVYWFATKNTTVGSMERRSAKKGDLLNWFSSWHEPITTLIEATEEQAILRNDIYDLSPLSQWGKGRVTLLGDAAHSMTPDLGQGASQAIEDALVLAQCAQRFGTTAEALRYYEQQRIERANIWVRRSRQAAQVTQLEHPLACSLRALLVGNPVANWLMVNSLEKSFWYDALH